MCEIIRDNNYLCKITLNSIITIMTFTAIALQVFQQSINDYHKYDNVDQPIQNPYPAGTIEADLYLKNWIDTVQWHFEDIIRDPEIDPVEALTLKRRIDRSNQERTDLVETIDSYFYTKYHNIKPLPDATINTESPAWAIDRLSILALKIYHMQEQVDRTDAHSRAHRTVPEASSTYSWEQRVDLSTAITNS